MSLMVLLNVLCNLKIFRRPMRRAVWKIPFRLDEIPFFDTTFLCEPAQPTNFTTFEEEAEPWDAPLRRRNNVSSQISSKIYHGNRNDSLLAEIGMEDAILVNEPFTRDPDANIKKMNARRYSATPRQSLSSISGDYSPVSYSPTPYTRPNMDNLREQYSSGNGGDVSFKNNSIKKRAAPKPPVESYHEQLEQRSYKKGPAPTRPISPYQAPRTDPIREMESIGMKEV